MTSAVFFGLTQPDTPVARQTKYQCPSGDCTWDTYQSLAVCSGCTDLTDRLNRISRSDPESNRNETVYELPNSLVLRNWDIAPSFVLTAGFGTGNASQSVAFGAKDTLIWSMTLIRVVDPGVLWPNSPVTAAECGLWYCVKNYSSTVKDSNLIELSSPAPSTRLRNSWQFVPSDGADSSGSQAPDTLTVDNNPFSYKMLTDLQLGAGFNVSQAAIYGISNLMETTFTENLGSDMPFESNDYDGSESSYNVGNGGNAVVTNSDKLNYHPPVMQNLHQSQDLNATFATLAKSMTNCIRENSDDNVVAIGKVGTVHPVIQVRWEFLILPFILILANAIFLAMVIYYTHMSGLAVLCSGALATLGLGESIGSDIFNFNKVRLRSRMEEAAKYQQVRLISSPTEKNPTVLVISDVDKHA